MGTFIPPNGFAGLAQQTPAVQQLFRKRGNGNGGRRRKKNGAVATVKRVARRAKSAAGRLKKGSAAAKAWGAKMRRLRKRK